MEAQVSSHSPSFLLKVGHFSHLLWLRCCAVQWRFRWFPLPNLKLLEFFSFSPLPLLAKCRRVRRRRKRLRQTERRKRRKRFAAPPTMIDSLPPFFSSVYFCPFRNFEKEGENKTEQFPFDFNYRSRCGRNEKRASDCLTMCQLSVVPFLALPGTSQLPKCAGKQRLAIEERIVRRGYFRPCGICLPFSIVRPSFKHSFSFVALLEGYLTAIQL